MVVFVCVVAQMEVDNLQVQSRVGSAGPGRPSLERPTPPDATAMESFPGSARLDLKMQRVREMLDSVLVRSPARLVRLFLFSLKKSL